MKSAKTKIIFFLSALALLIISSCTNTPDNIPFPENETDFPQPVSKPLKFGDVKKLNWSNDVRHIKPLIKKFDFNKLPEKIYDSLSFLPFSKKPDSVKFDWDKLPDTVFDYNKLPSTPLKFETSVLATPELIQAGPPHLTKEIFNIIYELHVPTGDDILFIFEDKAGFLWIATDQGLYRYDGEDFLFYLHTPSYSTITSILEDKQGQIWIGINLQGHPSKRFDYSTGDIIIIDPKASIIKLLAIYQGSREEGINTMALDDKGRIWATSVYGTVFIIDGISNTIKQFTRAQGLSGFPYEIIKDNKNNIWISTFSEGINILDLKNGKIKYLNKSTGLSIDTASAMLLDNMNKVWLPGLFGKLNSVDMQSGTIIHYDNIFTKNNQYYAALDLLHDNTGNIWMGEWAEKDKPPNGIVIIDPAKELIKNINTSNGLSSNIISAMLRDKRGQIWITTEAGLNMVNRNGNDIQHLGKTVISGLLEDSQGKIWIGNPTSGIDILDPSTGLSRSFTTTQGLSSNREQNMIESDRKIFIMTNGGIDIIDSSRKTIEHIGKLQGLKTDIIKGMIRDNQGLYWISEYSEAGVDVLNLQKNTIHHIGIEQGLNDSSLNEIKQDSRGRIWFISSSGVGIIDTKSNTIKYPNNLPGLRDHPNGSSLLEDTQGNMWIGTDKGIDMINAKTDSFISFSTHEGLLDNKIFSLNKYADRVYVGTAGGINILTSPNTEQKNWKIESYGKLQGINKFDESVNSDIITKNGRFLWGDQGITILNSIGDTMIPKTYIKSIDIFNRPQYFSNNPWSYIGKEDTLWSSLKDSFYVNGKLPASHPFVNQNKMKWDSVTSAFNMPVNLLLTYDENYLQFYFSQVNSGSADQTWYRYILEGIDKSWSHKTTNAYSENYPNLHPGNYIFRVCSEGSNGLWSKPAGLKFTILSPFWQTWWFYLTEAITGIAFVYWIIRLYTARKLAKQRIEFEKLRAVSTERERIASDMHDDLGAGLTSIRLLSEVANLKAGKDNVAKSEIEKIVKSTDHLSENLREIIWTMNTRFDKLEDFIIYIRTYAVEFFDNSPITFQFNKPVFIPEVKMAGELRRNLFLCIKEALNNIVKHSGATEAELTFDIVNNVLFTQIKDNGKGIDTSQINKFGNGLNSMKERLNKYGSKLKIEVNNGTNLQFEINVSPM